MDNNRKSIVPCPKCGQRLRLPNDSRVILRCPKCRHSWEEAEALDMRQQVSRALCLVKSEDPRSRDEGMQLFKWLYDNREKLVANVWQGFKLTNAILMIILFPDRISEAGEVLGEFVE